MAWSKPQFSKAQIDAAGRILAPPLVNGELFPSEPETGFELVPDGGDLPTSEWDDALDIISNWRAAHSYPLLATRVTLTTRAEN